MSEFYSSITDAHHIIKESNSKRNNIPSIHGKAALLALDSDHEELLRVIKNLKY